MADIALASSWQNLISKVAADPQVTPHLKGHLDLAVPKGVLDDTLYIEVPSETTRSMLQVRLRRTRSWGLSLSLRKLVVPPALLL